MARRKKPPRPRSGKTDLLVCLGLLALIWAVFGQTLGHDFVNYDDRVYVTHNPHVNGGLSFAGVKWAFTHAHAGNWHPLTTLSHMLDCQFFDLNPAAHHAVNVILHCATVLLLFVFLRRATGRSGQIDNIWRSAFVAAIFAIHPLRVESVAWIAERKDVLSALFFMLTLIAYDRYQRRPSVWRYFAVAIFCACGLMSKPMLVTLPFVLLLLDYWPLGRLSNFATLARLTVEKLPLLALAVAMSVITFVVQERSPGAIVPLPFAWRIENAIVSYAIYIRQMFWPAGLAVFYPHPENHLAVWEVAVCAILLAAITIAVFRGRLTKPYLLVGWLWYVGMLLPVIGIVEVGLQGHADRYTYLPEIGLTISIVWLLGDLFAAMRWRRSVLAVAGSAAVLALTACAWKQTAYWKNSETLWTRTLALTPQSDVAQTNMGIVLMDRGEIQNAIDHFQTALQIRSGSAHSHYDLSLALIHTNLGYAFARLGQIDDAVEQWRQAVQAQPNYPDAHYNLATSFLRKGEPDAAIDEYNKVLSIRPDDVEAHTSLGNALAQQGHWRDAIAQYETALETAPHSVLAANNLAWILAAGPDDSVRDNARAIQLARTVDQYSDGRDPLFIRTLAAAYAQSGLFADAIATTQMAIEFAHQNNDPDVAAELAKDLELYQQNRPLRDPSLTNAH